MYTSRAVNYLFFDLPRKQWLTLVIRFGRAAERREYLPRKRGFADPPLAAPAVKNIIPERPKRAVSKHADGELFSTPEAVFNGHGLWTRGSDSHTRYLITCSD